MGPEVAKRSVTAADQRTPETIAAELDAAERITLFYLATGTRVPGNSARTRSRLIVKGLIEREGLRLVVTDQGRAVLAALLDE
jgi:hypothetical protein